MYNRRLILEVEFHHVHLDACAGRSYGTIEQEHTTH